MLSPADEFPAPNSPDEADGDWTADCDDDWAAAAILVEQMFVTAMASQCVGAKKPLGVEAAEVPSALPSPIAQAISADFLVASKKAGLVTDCEIDSSSDCLPTPLIKYSKNDAATMVSVEFSAPALLAKVNAYDHFDSNNVFAWEDDYEDGKDEMSSIARATTSFEEKETVSSTNATTVIYLPQQVDVGHSADKVEFSHISDTRDNLMEDTQTSTCFEEDRSSEEEEENVQHEAMRLVQACTRPAPCALEYPCIAQTFEETASESSGPSSVDVNDSFEMDAITAEEDRVQEELFFIGKSLPECQRREPLKGQRACATSPPMTMKQFYRNLNIEPSTINPPRATEDDWLHSQISCFCEGPATVNDVLSMVENPADPCVIPIASDDESPKVQQKVPKTVTERASRTRHRVLDVPTRSSSMSRMVAPSAMDMDLADSPSSTSPMQRRSPSTSALASSLRRSNSSSRLDIKMPGAPSKLNPLRLKGVSSQQDHGPISQGSLVWSMRSSRRASGPGLRFGSGGYGGFGGAAGPMGF